MSIHFADETEQLGWNERVLTNPDGGNILQSLEMANQKTLGGWKPRYIITDNLAFVALERSVFGLGKLWYVIKGPGVITSEQLAAFLPELRRFAAANSVFLVKIEPEIIKTDTSENTLLAAGLLKTNNIQPNASTVLLDLSDSLDEIMASLHQKGRHAIRRAERDGVTIEQVPASDENCEKMFNLYKITAEGQFATRPYSYYKYFWQSFEQAGMGQMFFAYFDGQLVASAYSLLFGTKSTYKDGASVRERPVYGASHLLQWRMIEWAKSRGATVHDFCGAPPSNQLSNPQHPYYGFGRFKTSFSKHVVDFVGAYDIVIQPLPYRLWTLCGEKIALRLHRRRYHESYY